jgi:hypothetical protein
MADQSTVLITGSAQFTFKSTALETTVRSFGVLDDTAAQQDWGCPAKPADLTTVKLFVQEVKGYPDRILALELFG